MYITASLTGINIYSVPLIKGWISFDLTRGSFLQSMLQPIIFIIYRCTSSLTSVRNTQLFIYFLFQKLNASHRSSFYAARMSKFRSKVKFLAKICMEVEHRCLILMS